ncbi:hypothetical protein Ahy_B10g102988 [Arachis hypogaea]|uniref:Uncharacterized protein n=1 Tax=Arachis hypogaea TaxID=3818 RepID=A0A444X2X7_ARAHY|nr:hypothetical protein Ahy_B10g102988 [Arachis hypogaea]
MKLLALNIIKAQNNHPDFRPRSDPPDEKLNSALLLSRRTYPPRDSWNLYGLRWGKSTKARQIDRPLSRC